MMNIITNEKLRSIVKNAICAYEAELEKQDFATADELHAVLLYEFGMTEDEYNAIFATDTADNDEMHGSFPTRFGSAAKDGDYVLVSDMNYVGRSCKTLLAQIHNGKAYTGIKQDDGKRYIHKVKAEVVVPESIVPDETKRLIAADIALHVK